MVVSSEANEKLILALPKGRIFKEAVPLFARAGIEPESAFADPDARQLRFTTNHDDLDIIRVRSFDVATFVAFGAAEQHARVRTGRDDHVLRFHKVALALGAAAAFRHHLDGVDAVFRRTGQHI